MLPVKELKGRKKSPILVLEGKKTHMWQKKKKAQLKLWKAKISRLFSRGWSV